MRSAFGAGFPLFASQMYARLSIPGASSLLGGLAIVFIPIPFVYVTAICFAVCIGLTSYLPGFTNVC